MRQLARSRIFWLIVALVALDVVLHLTAPASRPVLANLPQTAPVRYWPPQTTGEAIGGTIGGLMVLWVIFAFFHGMHLTFRGWRGFHHRMKTDGIWKQQ
jgi:hypothetical protein